MSLHDVDKGSFDRGSPIPNHHDQIIDGAHKNHGTNSANYTTDATTSPSGGTNTGTPGGGATVAAGFKRLVLTCPMTVTNNGATLTTATLAHGLPFVPVVEASIDNANTTIAGGTATGASIPLPTFTSASIAGAQVQFGTWLTAFGDATNVYVNMLNATGSPVTITVTCYLYQRVS